MIIVTGTRRSGTSLWMHLLSASGLPIIGERFPGGWGTLLNEANPDGYFESELMAGIYFRTNPHPQTGAYLSPQQTREHAVKVFIPGLVRTDVAFIDRCLATVRSWRDYVRSTRRVAAMQVSSSGEPTAHSLPPALEWWCSNYGFIRDLAIRGYPAHVVSFDALLRDPVRATSDVLRWIGQGDVDRVADIVQPELSGANAARDETDAELAGGLDVAHLEVFDALYETIDGEQPLSAKFITKLNATDVALRPQVLEHQASAQANTVADILGAG